jgi:hypothetical protein
MPQLERLIIRFISPLPNPDPASVALAQLLLNPNMMPVTLTDLRQFVFYGTATYLEVLIARISAPFLGILHIYFFYQPLSFTVPHLLQFMQSSQKLRFSMVKLSFNSGGNDAQDAFAELLDERETAGHPVSLSLVDPSRF